MRRVLLFLAFALLILGAHHVHAHHVQEPTAPVTGVSLKVGPYPGINHHPFACDGSDVVSLDFVRIEPMVHFESRPSEHWTVRMKVLAPADNRSGQSLDWDIWPMRHQNAAPHGTFERRSELGQFNQYNLLDRPGLWTVTVSVRGEESGYVFKDECVFRVTKEAE